MKGKINKRCVDGLYMLLPIVGVLLCLLAMYTRNAQASYAITIPMNFQGEFSYDGVDWYSMEEYEITAAQPQVVIRGNIKYEFKDKWRLYFFRDHIGVSIYKNGELIYKDAQTQVGEIGIGLQDYMCGRSWDVCLMPGIKPEDVIEICCVNYHEFGNEAAYRYLMDSLTITGDTDEVVRNELNKMQRGPEVVASVSVILAIMLLGAAVLAWAMQERASSILGLCGLVVLCFAGFVFFDTVQIMELNHLVALSTYGQFLCMICYTYFLRILFCKHTRLGIYKIAKIGCLAELMLDVGIMILVFLNKVLIYDILFYWWIAQWILCFVFIAICTIGFVNRNYKKRWIFIAFFVMQTTQVLDMAGVLRTVYSSGTCTKIAFAVIVVFCVFYLLKGIILDYSAANRARELEEQLIQKRIALAMSQIRTHFIFNVLTVISSFCKSDAKKADEALICFSRYLRRNISIIEKEQLVFFAEELEHLEDYITLEQMRFEDAIAFEKNLNVIDFKVPPLVVQPMVENAIKHGFIESGKSGTVRLITEKDDRHISIIICDNGAGFDTEKPLKEESVGIKNVRFRIKEMVGGSLEIKSEVGKGTKVTIKLPIQEEEHESNLRG